MIHTASTHVRLRATALWLAATLVTAAVLAVAPGEAHALATGPARDFARLLVQVCATLALVAALCLWALASQVAVLAWRGPDALAPRRLGPVRSALLALCGVAVLSGTTPAIATPDHDSGSAPVPARALSGLPLPDRATGSLAHALPDERAIVRVRAGDALWTIAERHLGPQVRPSDVAAYTRRLHAANRAVIGPDPDLIRPGQRLRLPSA